MSTISDSLLTPLHDGVLECMDILCKEVLPPLSPLKSMIATIFSQLLSFSKFACVPPTFDRLETRYVVDQSFKLLLLRHFLLLMYLSSCVLFQTIQIESQSTPQSESFDNRMG